jgi:hypothetical protein
MPTDDPPAPAPDLPALTPDEAFAVHQALYHLLSYVPADHLWSQDERTLWDDADAAMRRVRGMPKDEAN